MSIKGNYHQQEKNPVFHCIIKNKKRRDEKSQFLKVIKNVVDELSKGLFPGDSMKVLKVHVVKMMKVHKAHTRYHNKFKNAYSHEIVK